MLKTDYIMVHKQYDSTLEHFILEPYPPFKKKRKRNYTRLAGKLSLVVNFLKLVL